MDTLETAIARPARLKVGQVVIRVRRRGVTIREEYTVVGYQSHDGGSFLHLVDSDGDKLSVGPASLVREEFLQLRPGKSRPAASSTNTRSRRGYWWDRD